MAKRTERLDSVRNGRPVVAIDEELLRKIEAEDEKTEEVVTSRPTGEEKIVKPKLGK